MNNNCDKMRDQIADLVSGLLSETEVQALERHLRECSVCKDYTQALQKEDQLLAGLFEQLDANMTGRQEQIINAVDRLAVPGWFNVILFSRMIMRNSLVRFTATAAVIVFLVLYFIITLTWISQIKECIVYASLL